MKFHLDNQAYEPMAAATYLSNATEDWQKDIGDFLLNWFEAQKKTNAFIYQKTSGSTGKPKEIKIPIVHMRNSALMTGRYFGFEAMKQRDIKKFLLCLPAHYIAGKMMIVRALVWDIDLYCVQPKSNPLLDIDLSFDFTAMIPMQVQMILEETETDRKFGKIDKVLIGGAAVSSNLLEKLQTQQTACFASYGMTETVSHVAIRKLNGTGASEFYQPLENITLTQDERNCLQIDAPLLNQELLTTNDLVEFNEAGDFRFLGRWDNVVNSGGVKLIVEELEKKMSPFIQENFYLKGVFDEKLGEKLVLFVEGTVWSELKQDDLLGDLGTVLTKFEFPKSIVFKPAFERTTSGKIKRV